MSSPVIVPPLAGSILGSTEDAFVVAEWRDPGGAVIDAAQLKLRGA